MRPTLNYIFLKTIETNDENGIEGTSDFVAKFRYKKQYSCKSPCYGIPINPK